MITLEQNTQLVSIPNQTDLYGLGVKQEVILKAALEEASQTKGNISHVYTLLNILADLMLTPDQMDAISDLIVEHKTPEFLARFNAVKESTDNNSNAQ